MDPSSSDFEFFDFKNSSDEEIKEIQAILKGPGSNGCVELPWEISAQDNYAEGLPETEGTVEETSTEPIKSVEDTTDQVGFDSPQAPLSPVAQLPPPTVETFVTLPTTVGPYQNAPYFVSRTLPYLRAYPPMGVPFFACPLPGTGEANPYGQFVPMVPAGQEKFAGQLENEPNSKSNREQPDRQSNRRSKKRLSGGTESSDCIDTYQEPAGSPVVGPTSVPLVPLPVPPSTFAGGTIPLHGYPPGLHTLPYTQQASSPAMYYVPLFNHPYGGYPSGPPMMLPVSVTAEVSELVAETHSDEIQTSPVSVTAEKCSSGIDNGGSEEEFQPTYSVVVPESLVDDTTPNVQTDCVEDTLPVSPTAKTPDVSETEARIIDSSDPPSEPLSEGSSPGYLQETEDSPEEAIVSTDIRLPTVDTVSLKNCQQVPVVCQPTTSENVKQVVRDPSRCWADLFKSPREVNGFEAQLPPPKQRHQRSTFRKDITNGKVYSVPASDSLH